MNARSLLHALPNAGVPLLALVLLAGCASVEARRSPDPAISESEQRARSAQQSAQAAEQRARSAQLEARAQRERAEDLERTVTALREDLADAGQTLIDIESGLRGAHTRADAVSRLAEARILVERADRAAPWRASEIVACQDRLAEADRHVQAGHFGTAIFFASRAQRASARLLDEASRIAARGDLLFVQGQRVNLRARPTTRGRVLERLERGTPVLGAGREGGWVRVRTLEGQVGWMHGRLLGAAAPAAAASSPDAP